MHCVSACCVFVTVGRAQDEGPSVGAARQEPVPGPWRRRTAAGETDAAAAAAAAATRRLLHDDQRPTS